ncbi:MAG TPA: TetR family transcriptional regulator [Kribbella sp.]|uniref:TetR/AcrR family transcriptional regulator n=1 Tax=Kribbella sp. TaxID=1871183 RepID=UPI002D776ABA|nr:TetR family transcriptional regulator [Kribbella sp.]HET6296650.1 TetR family transcriptional regulator [Kribbella sp.]
MSGTVKPRRYDSPVREQRAQETRTAILDAAERLFATRGYVRTTLPTVATEAGVSLAMVKLAFGTKTELLLNVWHRTLAGGLDDRVPVVERDWHRQQYEIADPVERIRYSAGKGLVIRQRIAGLVAVIEAGATSDDTLAELQHRMFEEYLQVVRIFVQRLADDGHLRPELSVDQAADEMWLINHVNNYRLLVETRGWSPDQYLDWLTRTTIRALLPPHLHP